MKLPAPAKFIVPLLWWCGLGSGHAEPLRGPYLQNLTPRGVDVVWTSNGLGVGRLRYRSGGNWRTVIEPAPSTHHRATLPLERCDTPCRYRVGSTGEPLSRVSRFIPPRSTNDPLTVLVFGDSGDGGPAQYAVADALVRERAPVALHLGDIVYPSGLDEDYDPQFFAPYRRLLRSTVLYPALGNHDALNVGVFERIFALPEHSSRSGTERYYSFSLGLLHAIALDSNQALTPDSPQFQWLRNDLTQVDQSKTPWTIVFLHHPLYSSGSHGSTLALRGPLEELLEGAGVRLVLAGHDHDYERSEPGSRFGGTGIIHIVSGGGGNPNLYGRQNENTASQVFFSGHHYLKLTLSRRRLSIAALTPEGTTIDAVTVE